MCVYTYTHTHKEVDHFSIDSIVNLPEAQSILPSKRNRNLVIQGGILARYTVDPTRDVVSQQFVYPSRFETLKKMNQMPLYAIGL